ncbi:metal-dependent hydrolase [Allopontixanthobacter sediminis]|uniref:Metal-dependent hydrolase n=1 Tax=Allopontixanthobacter sediminis TaxID=1689985 RepID=A0A845B741_9SPHN|nr:metal-dependent hydrolase [Allopontixanthobacter sediminis]MXP43449.1 metal-dependent hydrolase [Allopontixanthobacter sediminis]
MDNLTHSLVGALLGQAGLKRKTGLAMPALIIGANLPDVDAACFFWLDGVEHLGFRRGITHGPPALVLLPLILAGLLYGFDRWQAKRGKRPEGRLPVSFKWLFLLSFLGCLTHPALDWLNVYGIRLLEPFSSQWFYSDTLFIIDVWLWALMGFAVWFSVRKEKRGGEWMKPARIAMAVALGYIGVNWVNTQMVVLHDPSLDDPILSPKPFVSWEREAIQDNRDGSFSIDGKAVGDAGLWRNCDWASLRRSNKQIEAFLFWSRAPFAERQPDNSVILRDARYYDQRARDRFSVALPDVRCLPLTQK